MAKKIKKIHDDILDIVRKSGVGVFVSHEQIDNYLHRAQLEKFVELLGSEKDYQVISSSRTGSAVARAISPISYPSSLKIHEDLREFITLPATKTTDSSGQLSLPKRTSTNNYSNVDWTTFDWIHINSVKTGSNKNVDILFEHEVAFKLDSKIDPPTTTDPVAVLYENIIQIYPQEAMNIKLSFLRTPLPPEYDYTKDSDGKEQSYNDGGSTDLEWPETVHSDIIARALYFISAPLQDVYLNRIAENKYRTR